MTVNDYSIPCNYISIRNPQVNVIVERVYQTIDNIIHMIKIQNMDLDNKNSWEGILSSIMFIILSTVYTNTWHSHTVKTDIG